MHSERGVKMDGCVPSTISTHECDDFTDCLDFLNVVQGSQLVKDGEELVKELQECTKWGEELVRKQRRF